MNFDHLLRIWIGLFCLLLLKSSPGLAFFRLGVYPTYPPAGPLRGMNAQEQARWLQCSGFQMAGGRFETKILPDAYREYGIQTLVLVPLFQGEAYWKRTPSARPVMADGKPLFKDHWYAGLCPNQPWLQEEKTKLIHKLLSSGFYDLLILDFIRYPTYWEVPQPRFPDTCYCSTCLRKFQRDTGVLLPQNLTEVPAIASWIKENHAEKWYRWRADQITGFVRRVKELRDELQSRTRISIALIPWTEQDYDNAIYRVVAQDISGLSKVVDAFSPMLYYQMLGKPPEWIDLYLSYLMKKTDKPIIPFHIVLPASKVPVAEWLEVFHRSHKSQVSGIILFPAGRVFNTVTLEAVRAFATKLKVIPAYCSE